MKVFVAAAFALLSLSDSAAARPSSSGWYTEGALGVQSFLGEHGSHARVGPSFDLRAGRDLFSWLSVGLHLGATTHQATVPPPPEGEYFQLYNLSAEGRLGVSAGWLSVFVDGSAGFALISTDILAKVGVLDPGESYTLRFAAGGGFEYQLQNRHYAFGVGAQWVLLPEFAAMNGITARAYLRYTY